jgi:hypothetical protein
MLNKTAVALALALLFSGALAVPCSAGTIISFTYSIPAPDPSYLAISASGLLTTIEQGPGVYLVVDIEGTRSVNGVPETITGLIAPGGYYNSNLLSLPGPPLLDGNGLSFTVAGSGNDGSGSVNVYSVTDYFGTVYTEAAGNVFYGAFDAEIVPEPSTFILVAVASAGLVALTSHRRRKPSGRR